VPFALQQVGTIEGARSDADEHLARSSFWTVDVTYLEHFRTTVPSDHSGTHAGVGDCVLRLESRANVAGVSAARSRRRESLGGRTNDVELAKHAAELRSGEVAVRSAVERRGCRE
jgi:hypothetical protein